MKESRFNYFTKDQGKVICLNGISGNVFAISEEAYPVLKEILENPDASKYNEDLYQSLYHLHFLIDNETNEIDILRRRYQASVKNSHYQLVVNPTQECNFRCWYCYEKHISGHMDAKVVNHIKRFIDKTLSREDISSFELSWFGGEPLLYFKDIMYPLACYAQREAEKVGKEFWQTMTSNGYYLTPEVIALCKETSLNTIQITLDGNRELHNRTRNEQGKPSFDKILDNVINFCQYSSENTVILRINYTAEVINAGLKDVFSTIPLEIRPQIKVLFQRVWQTVGIEQSQEALREHTDYVQNLGFPLASSTAYNLFQGRLCYADTINYANINFDGNVFRCTANEYCLKNRLGYLNEEGDIEWDDPKRIDETIHTAPFENELCLNCKKLAICGGLCFARRWENKYKEKKLHCVKIKLDTDVSDFLKDYYRKRMKRRQELKAQV